MRAVSVVVRAIGPGDPPATRELRRALRDADLADVPVRVDLVPELRVDLADEDGG